MKKQYLFLCLFGLICNFLLAQSEEDKVKECFANYVSAIKANEGKNALKYINVAGINFYTNTLEKAKTLPKEGLNKLLLAEKLQILVTRYCFPKEDILKMNGESLFIEMVNKGLLRDNNTAHLSIGQVTVNGDEAKGNVLYRGKEAGLVYSFVKEQEHWKIKAEEVIVMAEPFLQQAVEEAIEDGQTEDEFFESTVQLTGALKNITQQNDIWQPLKL